MGKSEGESLLGKARHRWENNIKMRNGSVYWINLAQNSEECVTFMKKIIMKFWAP